MENLFSSCSHNRSVEIFIETMKSAGNGFGATGFPCESIEDFEAGKCFSQPRHFSYGSYEVGSNEQKYFFLTGSSKEDGYLGKDIK